MAKKKVWTYKLPTTVGGIFLLLSLPFLLGILIPSIHEGNVYSTIYVLINALPILILGGLSDKIAHSLFGLPSLEQANAILIILSLIFWAFIAFCVGVFIDLTRLRKLQSNHE